jgi:hypothetical protein
MTKITSKPAIDKKWPAENFDERDYHYTSKERILYATWPEGDTTMIVPARDYASESTYPSEEEVERDVKLLKAMDRVGF